LVRSLKRDKKGATIDNLWMVVVFFGLAIFFIALTIFWNELSSQATDLWTGSSQGARIQTNMQNAANQFDFMVFIVWIGFHLGILATAYLLRTHPVIYIVAILITALLALIAAPLSNAYEDIRAEADLTTAADSMTMTNFVLDNYPQFEIIWALITMVVMLGLARSEGFV